MTTEDESLGAKPTIVFLMPSYGRSGGLRTLMEWANRSSLIFDTHVYAMTEDGGGDVLGRSVQVHPAPRFWGLLMRLLGHCPRLPSEYGRIAIARRYFSRVAARHPTAVIIGGFPPWTSSRYLRGRQQYIAYAQHDESMWFEGKRARQIARRSVFGAEKVIVNSSWLRGQLPASSQVEMVHPGVDLSIFHQSGSSRPPIRERFRIVSLGREVPHWKGLSDLREALRSSSAENVDLVLFGGGRGVKAPAPWGSETRLGPIGHADLAELYRSADLVVCPSWHESFPLPPLEAMASGVAVVTTAVGVSDYAQDRLNAIVVSPRSPLLIAEAIDLMRRDRVLRAFIAANGAESAKQYTWDAGFETFCGALSRLVGPLKSR